MAFATSPRAANPSGFLGACSLIFLLLQPFLLGTESFAAGIDPPYGDLAFIFIVANVQILVTIMTSVVILSHLGC